jgi:MYXO-CTERM domain-containing protein
VAKRGALAALAFGVALSVRANAATYQVGPGKTHTQLGQVANLLQPGDVVEIDGDATYTGGVAFWNAGTPSSKITIRGIRKNGKRPVISGGTNTIEAAGDHYVFEGLDLTAGSFRCFYHHAHDITLRDSVVHDCPAHGVLGADSDSGSLLMEYVEVYGCGDGTFEHQIYMATDESAHPGSVFRMQHCYVHDSTGGNNVKSRAERNEIYYNWIEGATYHELELIGPDGQNPGLAREDSDIVGNVLVKKTTTFVARFGGDGTGETHGRYRFVNNTVLVQPGGSAVFRLFHGIESLSVHNNVFAVVGAGTVNMVRMVEADWSTGAPLISGSSNWVASGATNLPATWTGTISGSDPGFTDLGAFDLRPLAASALVDAGSPSTPDPSGYDFPSPLAAPQWSPPLHELEPSGAAQVRVLSGPIDIGAYEYGTASSGGSAGSVGSGGAQPGGSAGAGAGGGAGGATAAGGTGAVGTGGGAAGNPASGASDDGGCGCRSAGSGRSGTPAWALLALLGALGRRRRRL